MGLFSLLRFENHVLTAYRVQGVTNLIFVRGSVMIEVFLMVKCELVNFTPDSVYYILQFNY